MALTKRDLREELRKELKYAFNEFEIKFDRKMDLKMDRRFKEQDDRFARLLMKHFYTKDETDRKFSAVNRRIDKLPTEAYVEHAVSDGIDRVKVLYEALDSKMDLVLENQIHANKRIDDIDGRVTNLERPV